MMEYNGETSLNLRRWRKELINATTSHPNECVYEGSYPKGNTSTIKGVNFLKMFIYLACEIIPS